MLHWTGSKIWNTTQEHGKINCSKVMIGVSEFWSTPGLARDMTWVLAYHMTQFCSWKPLWSTFKWPLNRFDTLLKWLKSFWYSFKKDPSQFVPLFAFSNFETGSIRFSSILVYRIDFSLHYLDIIFWTIYRGGLTMFARKVMLRTRHACHIQNKGD